MSPSVKLSNSNVCFFLCQQFIPGMFSLLFILLVHPGELENLVKVCLENIFGQVFENDLGTFVNWCLDYCVTFLLKLFCHY